MRRTAMESRGSGGAIRFGCSLVHAHATDLVWTGVRLLVYSTHTLGGRDTARFHVEGFKCRYGSVLTSEAERGVT